MERGKEDSFRIINFDLNGFTHHFTSIKKETVGDYIIYHKLGT